MRIALMADIHANREAFTACLAQARQRGADRYVFLGDYVGYGAVAVLGNHDHAVLEPNERMTEAAERAIAWTRERLGHEAREFIAQLPPRADDDDRLYCHALGLAPRRWYYVSDSADAGRALEESP